ncbi:MAG: succinate--CoA ligase subunit alpha [Euryarchaeota archaeon]|nr:succinate--CoA ligase subunit alpha [Euryarchaeota archaeon]
MAILLDNRTRVVVQGITGAQGRFHTARMKEYGTKVVAGVTPGKAGETIEGVPVFDTVEEAAEATEATASIIFVPAPYAKDAMLEAFHSGLDPVVVITEGVPVHDTLAALRVAESKEIHVVGPNTPGLITSGQAKMGIMPNHIFRPGPVGMISRSGTLTYEVSADLTNNGIGQSTCIGIGGDPAVGLDYVTLLKMFYRDPDTQAVVLIGEIGGRAEENAAAYLKRYPKPIVAYIAGRTAPPGKKMGHAGAIVSGTGGADHKIAALEKVGVKIAKTPVEVAHLVKAALGA